MGLNISKGVLMYQAFPEIFVLGGPNISEIFVLGVHFFIAPSSSSTHSVVSGRQPVYKRSWCPH